MVSTYLIIQLLSLDIDSSSLSALETLHVAVCIHMIYTYLIIDFSHPEMVLKIIWWVKKNRVVLGGNIELALGVVWCATYSLYRPSTMRRLTYLYTQQGFGLPGGTKWIFFWETSLTHMKVPICGIVSLWVVFVFPGHPGQCLLSTLYRHYIYRIWGRKSICVSASGMRSWLSLSRRLTSSQSSEQKYSGIRLSCE